MEEENRTEVVHLGSIILCPLAQVSNLFKLDLLKKSIHLPRSIMWPAVLKIGPFYKGNRCS